MHPARASLAVSSPRVRSGELTHSVASVLPDLGLAGISRCTAGRQVLQVPRLSVLLHPANARVGIRRSDQARQHSTSFARVTRYSVLGTSHGALLVLRVSWPGAHPLHTRFATPILACSVHALYTMWCMQASIHLYDLWHGSRAFLMVAPLERTDSLAE